MCETILSLGPVIYQSIFRTIEDDAPGEHATSFERSSKRIPHTILIPLFSSWNVPNKLLWGFQACYRFNFFILGPIVRIYCLMNDTLAFRFFPCLCQCCNCPNPRALVFNDANFTIVIIAPLPLVRLSASIVSASRQATRLPPGSGAYGEDCTARVRRADNRTQPVFLSTLYPTAPPNRSVSQPASYLSL
jgi:hypothetical protein